jgi:hypothetical protein
VENINILTSEISVMHRTAALSEMEAVCICPRVASAMQAASFKPASRKPAETLWRYLPVVRAGASVITIVVDVSPGFRSFSLRRSTAPNEIDLT